jgi:hypothetical protein
MLRILGLQGSAPAKLVIGAALIGLGVWRHGTIAVVLGVGLLLVAAVGAASGRHAGGADGGPGQGPAR